MCVGATAAKGFGRGKGSCAHFASDSPLLLLLLPQMLFVRQHRANPPGADTRGSYPLVGDASCSLAQHLAWLLPPRRGEGLPQQRREYVHWKQTSCVRHPHSSVKKFWKQGVSYFQLLESLEFPKEVISVIFPGETDIIM